MIAGKARAGPILCGQLGKLGDKVDMFSVGEKELCGACAVKVDEISDQPRGDGGQEHDNAHREQKVSALCVRLLVVVKKDGEHEEEGDGVECSQIRRGDEVEKRIAFIKEIIEKIEDISVEYKPRIGACPRKVQADQEENA